MHRFDKYNKPIFMGIKLLNEATELIGHNIIGFDIPALHKYSIKFTNWKNLKTFDTIIASKLVCTNLDKQDLGRVASGKMPSKLIGSHSLEAWGYRLGEHKGEYGVKLKDESDADYMERVWEHCNESMVDYCEQDVLLNVKLYYHLQEQIIKRGTTSKALDIEHAFAKIISRQERQGVLFDTPKALELENTLRVKASEALDVLRLSYKPKWFNKAPTKQQEHWCEVANPNNILEVCKKSDATYTHPNGAKYKAIKGKLFHRVSIAKANRRKKILCPLTGKEVLTTNSIKGSVSSPLELKEFNPNSGAHVIRWLKDLYGWEPTEFTDKGTPKTDEDTLGSLTFKGIEVLQNYQMVLKRLSQLADGKGALLKYVVRDTNRIHGRCDTLGAVTRRCTHSSPNLAQVPANRKPYGESFRSLFTVPTGYKMVGADGSGLELRTLAHYLHLFDGGAYSKIVLNGDIHTKHQHDAELATRDDAKTFIYAFLYGAGEQKLGSIVVPNGTAKEQKAVGRKLKKAFMLSNPDLKELLNTIKDRAGKRKFVYDLDGNKLFIRSEHSAPNMLLQSCGAIIMKYWSVEVDRVLQECGYENSDDVLHTDREHDYENVLNIHYEEQLEVKEDIAEHVSEIMSSAFNVVGEELHMNIRIDGEAQIGVNWKETH
jgi:DNA polymerase I-like protein with 3'-5' exonuclease and polymerase domains